MRSLLLFGCTLLSAAPCWRDRGESLSRMGRRGTSSEIALQSVDHHLFKGDLAQYFLNGDISRQLIGDVKRNLFSSFSHLAAVSSSISLAQSRIGQTIGETA